jgi:hypothetical protein
MMKPVMPEPTATIAAHARTNPIVNNCGRLLTSIDHRQIALRSREVQMSAGLRAPGMLRRRRFRIGLQEMMQNMKQGQDVLLITRELGCPYIIDDQVANFFRPVLLGQEVLSERCCDDFRKVFVLSNCQHLLFGQAAKSNAIFDRYHHATPSIGAAADVWQF